MNTLSPFAFLIVPVVFVVGVAILFIAIFQDSKTVGKPKAIGNAFFLIMSFVSLMTVAISVTYLAYTGLTATVFKNASSQNEYLLTPPALYLSESTPYGETLCSTEKGCTLTSTQKSDIKQWIDSYKSWKETTAQDVQNYRQMINALSILLVALPLFVVFYWMSEKHHKSSPEKSTMRFVYYYGAAFTGLGFAVIALGILLNTALISALIPKKAQVDPYPYITSKDPSYDQILSLKNCTSDCGLPADTGSVIDDWQKDYDTAFDKQQQTSNNQDDYASTLPVIIVGGLLFALHFSKIRSESKAEIKAQQAE